MKCFRDLNLDDPGFHRLWLLFVLVLRSSIRRRLLEPNNCARKESILNGIIIRTGFGFLEGVAGEFADEQGMPLIQVESAGLEMLRLRRRR
jgi:hypothetical protein